MPQKFNDNDLLTCYQAVEKGIKRVQLMEMFNITWEQTLEMYHQATLKHGPRSKQKPLKKPPAGKRHQPPPKQEKVYHRPFVRIKGQYSNRSPYGIASPGIN
ncbi:hypothetical protein [Limnovirga soli]|uniref:Uncharacterized protein n=1 Tax=Limnovirga soli TaxID=2656915 RepID=A0A8J8FD59_9BACT|nr:hypothetical protein [Limnovirga soli]NNV55890.1 hypothetical protein [Limnovirga soli]